MDSRSPGTQDVDMRGFRHALEALHMRESWNLEKLMTAHRHLQQQLKSKQSQVDETVALQVSEKTAIAQKLRIALDPGYHHRALAYLGQLAQRLTTERKLLADAEKALTESSRACVAQQLKVEALLQNRDTAAADYAVEQRAMQAAEADRSWSARQRPAARVTTVEDAH